MKVKWANSDFDHLHKRISSVLEAEISEAMSRSAEAVAEEARADAPDEVVNSIQVEEASAYEPAKVIADDSAAFRLHEMPEFQVTPSPREQASMSGGIGPKFLERPAFALSKRIEKHLMESVKNKLEGKASPSFKRN